MTEKARSEVIRGEQTPFPQHSTATGLPPLPSYYPFSGPADTYQLLDLHVDGGILVLLLVSALPHVLLVLAVVLLPPLQLVLLELPIAKVPQVTLKQTYTNTHARAQKTRGYTAR